MTQTLFLITEEAFSDALRKPLDEQYTRALMVFHQYLAHGAQWAHEMADALMHAAAQQKVCKVLSLLEEHCTRPNQIVFDQIFGEILQLELV